jgi:hypothetical protein
MPCRVGELAKVCRSTAAGKLFITSRCLEIPDMLSELAWPCDMEEEGLEGKMLALNFCRMHMLPLTSQRAVLKVLLETFALMPTLPLAQLLAAYSFHDDPLSPVVYGCPGRVMDSMAADLVGKLCYRGVASLKNAEDLALPDSIPSKAVRIFIAVGKHARSHATCQIGKDCTAERDLFEQVSSRLQGHLKRPAECISPPEVAATAEEGLDSEGTTRMKKKWKQPPPLPLPQQSLPAAQFSQPDYALSQIPQFTLPVSPTSACKPAEALPEAMAASVKSTAEALALALTDPTSIPAATKSCLDLLALIVESVELKDNMARGIELACEATGLKTAPDDVLFSVCGSFLNARTGLRACEGLIRGALLPKVQMMKGPASRQMVAVIRDIAADRPDAAVDGLLVPLATWSLAQNPQSELCVRLVKSKEILPTDKLEKVLSGILQENNSPTWSAAIVPVLTALLNQKLPLSDVTIALLVKRLDDASLQEEPLLNQHKKFVTLVHTVLTKYAPQAQKHLVQLRAIVSRCGTFMAKSCQSALDRCS